MSFESGAESNQIAIIDERTIRDKIYEVRGEKVMLDFELAEIYGYTTKAFNQQVKNIMGKRMSVYSIAELPPRMRL